MKATLCRQHNVMLYLDTLARNSYRMQRTCTYTRTYLFILCVYHHMRDYM